MMSLKIVVLMTLFASFVVAVPVGKVFTSKHVQWIDDDVDETDLLSPIDNLVEPEEYEVTDDAQPAEVNQKSENFVTGHRIPLELFSPDTLKRIELIPETESSSETTPSSTDGRYVNSESFRSGQTTTEAKTESRPEPRPHFFEDDRELLLGAKIDPNYRRTLIKFLPDY